MHAPAPQDPRSALILLLAECYPHADSSRRVATDAGLNTAQIKLAGSAQDNWFNVVEHARTNGLLLALIDSVALEHYGSPVYDKIKVIQNNLTVAGALGPTPGTTSSIMPPNNLPLRRVFIGRKAELKAIKAAFHGIRHAVRRVSLSGLGGCGKTSLALNYAYQEAHTYPGGIYWLNAENGSLEAMVQLWHLLGTIGPAPVREVTARTQPDPSAGKLAELAKLGLQAQTQPSLLILDDISAADTMAYLPQGNVNVLTTTRDSRLGFHPGIGKNIEIGSLRNEDALTVARSLAPPRDRADAAVMTKIVTVDVAALAVAVEMAALSVAGWAMTWTQYGRHLQSKKAYILQDPDAFGSYKRGVYSAIDLSIDKCSSHESARKYLAAAAVFAPEFVPVGWVAAAANLDATSIEAAKSRDLLRKLGLITLNALDHGKSTISMHRLVHDRVRDRARREWPDEWREASSRCAEHVVSWLVEAVGTGLNDEIDALRLHIGEAMLAAEHVGNKHWWIKLADRLATHLQHRAVYEEALDLFERALNMAQALNPPRPEERDMQVATSLVNYAGALYDIADRKRTTDEDSRTTGARERTYLERSRMLFQQSLEIVRRVYGANDRKVATRLSGLAEVLHRLGDDAQALQLHRQALTIMENTAEAKLRGRDLKLATCLGNLALVLVTTKKYDEALTHLRRAIEIALQASKEKSCDTLIAKWRWNLAKVLSARGALDEARVLLELALTTYETTHGPEHPDTKEIWSLLGTIERNARLTQPVINTGNDEKRTATEDRPFEVSSLTNNVSGKIKG